MIAVDIAQLEILTDLITRSAANADDVLHHLRGVSVEMQDDTELPLYAPTGVLLESVALAIQALNRSTDTLLSLKAALLPAAERYRETEEQHQAALNRMTLYANAVNTAFCAAVTAQSIPAVAQTDAAAAQDRVEQLVTGHLVDMQTANIAAIAHAVREDYDVRAVKSMDPDA